MEVPSWKLSRLFHNLLSFSAIFFQIPFRIFPNISTLQLYLEFIFLNSRSFGDRGCNKKFCFVSFPLSFRSFYVQKAAAWIFCLVCADSNILLLYHLSIGSLFSVGISERLRCEIHFLSSKETPSPIIKSLCHGNPFYSFINCMQSSSHGSWFQAITSNWRSSVKCSDFTRF